MNSKSLLPHPPQYQTSGFPRFWVLLAVCISAMVIPLSQSGILISIPTIARDLNTDVVYVSWIPSVFLLSNLAAQIPAGRLADLHGRKRLFLIGNALFVLASLVVASADHITTLLVFRALQGVAAAAIFSSGFALIGCVYQGTGRGAALGWMATSVYTGLATGPLLGGWITEHTSWRYVFLFPVPLLSCIVAFGLWRIKEEWKDPQAIALDWLGALLLGVGFVALFVGLIQLPGGLFMLLLPISIIAFWWFVQRSLTKPYALIRIKTIWENRVFSCAMLASVFMYSGMNGLIFLLGLYFQYDRNMTPSQAGQMIMLQAAVMALMAPLAGRLVERYPARHIASLGSVVVALGMLGLFFLGTQTPLLWIGACIMLLGLGFGLFSTPNNVSALHTIAPEKLGIASALLNIARLNGQMLGMGSATFLIALLIGSGGAPTTPPHQHELIQVVRWAIASSFIFALLAIWFSWRGRPRTGSDVATVKLQGRK